MTTDHDLERRLAGYYAGEAQLRAPDRVLQAALATIEDTRQRHAVLGLPWRFTKMSGNAKLAVAAGAVIAVVGVGLALMWSGGLPPGGNSTPSPSPSPAPSPTSAGPALTQTFTSEIHGISISYPADWTVKAATEPWTADLPRFEEPAGDFISGPAQAAQLFLALASQPLDSKSPDAWAADQLEFLGCSPGEPLTVDGAVGVSASDCDVALVSTDDRGYLIMLYVSGDDPALGDTYDSRWFEDVLATVELSPEEALD